MEIKKVKISLKIDVKKVDFDPVECTIRISGQNREENKYVKMVRDPSFKAPLHIMTEIGKHTNNVNRKC